MTFLENYDDAINKLPSAVKGLKDTLRTSLIAATVAQNKLQSKSRAVKREWSFASSSLDADGRIAKDADCGAIQIMEFVSGSGTRSSALEVTPLAPEMYRRMLRNGNTRRPSVEMFFSDYNLGIYIYPISGFSGTFYATHVAKLKSYTVAAGLLSTGYYANFEADLDAACAANGIEPEFDFAQDGISSYTAWSILDAQPSLKAIDPTLSGKLWHEWEECISAVVLANPPGGQRVTTGLYTGPTR